jgi:hypothetical protein
MISKIKGYIGGKETFLGKDDLGKCNFCDKFVTPINFIWQKTSEQFDKFRESLGELPNDAAGKIGNKIICKDCLGDLEMLLPFKYCDDD